MKKRLFYPLLFGLGILSNVQALEIDERLPRPEEAKNYTELRSTIERLEEEKKESEEEKKRLELPSKIAQEDDRIQLIEYGLARAKSIEVDIYPKQAKERIGQGDKDFDNYKQTVKDTEQTLQQKIESQLITAQLKLAGEIYVSQTSEQMSTGLMNATNTLNGLFFSRPEQVTQAYREKVTKFTDTLNTVLNVQTLINEAEEQETIDKKLDVFSKPRTSIVELQKSVEQEIESLNNERLNKPKRPDLDAYLDSLKELHKTVIARLNEMDQKQLQIAGIPEKPSFFKSLFDNVVNIVNNLRLAFTRAIPIPDQIISQINKANRNLVPAANIVAVVDGLANRAQELISQATVESRIKVDGKPAISDFTKQQLQDLRSTLRNLERQFSPDDQSKISQTYKQLQALTGDLSAFGNRNRGGYPTLFDQLYDFYKSDKIFGRTSFGPEQAYEALNLKPGASEQAIKEARANAAKLDFATPAGLAARNASFILGNPVSKITYDAFLKDFNKLKSAGFDPADQNKTDVVKKQLTATAAIEVGDRTVEQLVNDVWPIFKAVFIEAEGLGKQIGDVEEFPPIFIRIGEITKQIDALLGQ